MRFIHGNGDRVVLAQMRGQEISEVPEQYREVIQGLNMRLAVCGHTHMPFDRTVE